MFPAIEIADGLGTEYEVVDIDAVDMNSSPMRGRLSYTPAIPPGAETIRVSFESLTVAIDRPLRHLFELSRYRPTPKGRLRISDAEDGGRPRSKATRKPPTARTTRTTVPTETSMPSSRTPPDSEVARWSQIYGPGSTGSPWRTIHLHALHPISRIARRVMTRSQVASRSTKTFASFRTACIAGRRDTRRRLAQHLPSKPRCMSGMPRFWWRRSSERMRSGDPAIGTMLP
jgi:hypothetical protein